jgi:hypothetical protein
MAFENLIIRTKRVIEGANISIQLDAVIRESFSTPIRPTLNPIENGAQITDHAVREPRFYTMDAGISDTPLGVVAFGQVVDNITGLIGDSTGNGLTRSQQAYALLVKLQYQMEPITIVTGLNILRNMLILDIRPTKTKDDAGALLFTADLMEVIITETQLIIRDENNTRGDDYLSGATPENLGRQLPQPIDTTIDQSFLSRLLERIGGAN